MDDLYEKNKGVMPSVFRDAEAFTDSMIKLTSNNMQSSQLSGQALPEVVLNMIRILNLDVEERMSTVTCSTGKLIIILFAKNTVIGKKSVYFRESLIHEGKTVNIIVLPNDELIDKLENDYIISNLDYIYTFILGTKKASAEYISPIEIYKHIFARYFFKIKYFIKTFELEDSTIDELIEDLKSGTDGMIDYNDIATEVYDNTSASELFDYNACLKYFTTDSYFDIIDVLNGKYDYYEDTEEDSDAEEYISSDNKEDVDVDDKK